MVERKEQWVTSDGKPFDTEAEATIHERNLQYAQAGKDMRPWIEKYLRLTGRYKTEKRLPSEIQRYQQFAVAMMSYQQDGDLLVDATVEDTNAEAVPETGAVFGSEVKEEAPAADEKKPAAKKAAAKKRTAKA